MIAFVLGSLALGGGGCQVVVANRSVVQSYAAPVATVSYGHAYQSPYYTASALAYKVEDPEKSALYRQNEKLTDALVVELQAARQRAERLESAIATTGDPSGIEPMRAQPAAATVILQRHCISCHAGDKSKGGFSLSKTPNLSERLLVNAMVNGQDASMPPKDKKQLTAEEKKIIAEWAVVTKEELKAAAMQTAKGDRQ